MEAEYVVARFKPYPGIWNFYQTIEAAQIDACAINARPRIKKEIEEGAEPYRPMTWDEYRAGQKAHYLDPLKEILAEDWEYALNVLPPVRWEQVDGVERFMMSERICDTITASYAKFNGRYFRRNVDMADRSTWITADECRRFIAAHGKKEG